MTRNEHERERRAFWDACYLLPLDYDQSCGVSEAECRTHVANTGLAERDKRWPEPAEPKTSAGQDADEADECETCKFRTIDPFQEPCRSCSTISLTTTSHWKPIK